MKSGENVKNTVISIINLLERRHDIVGKEKYVMNTSERIRKAIGANKAANLNIIVRIDRCIS
ncbi:hypothetical protein [Marinisporobacter balticus]|uniref:Uncharacterized protein n=1 Tax=Marinisporobacter balticus TaxID=2018667 RepID=A0A4V2SC37_9FIRM|nr:hypothetical protein [Marinisporobacter balticus]TCO77430.1 hypothetical protein EV214_10672 [Marinisporobacter balticus]